MGKERFTVSCSSLLDIADRLAEAAEALDQIRPTIVATDHFLSGGGRKFDAFVRELSEWELAFRAGTHDSVTEPPEGDRVA